MSLPSFSFLSTVSLILLLLYIIYKSTHELLFSPLSSIPGPWYAAISPLWLTSHVARFRLCRVVEECFETYGPIVRVAPNKIIFRDLASMRAIYGPTLRFPKAESYKNLCTNENDHAMTVLDHTSHVPRRRAFAPHYTPSNLARWQPEIHALVQELLHILYSLNSTRPSTTTTTTTATKTNPGPTAMAIDTLPLLRALMIDLNALTSLGFRANALSKCFTLNLALNAKHNADANLNLNANASREDTEEDELSMAVNDFGKRGLIKGVIPSWAWYWVTRIPHARWRKLCDADRILAEFVSARVYETRAALLSGKIRVDGVDGADAASGAASADSGVGAGTGGDGKEKPTMLARLLTVRNGNGVGEGIGMGDKDVISEGMGHLIASSDTTSTTLSYCFFELSRRPDVVRRLRAELDDVMPTPLSVGVGLGENEFEKEKDVGAGGIVIPDIAVLQRLPYLNAFIKEGLRLYGDAPSLLERVVPPSSSSSSNTKSNTNANNDKPFTLLGYTIPPGTIVATQAWSMHRTPGIFPSAETFLPDRWLAPIPGSSPTPNSFALPGPGSCACPHLQVHSDITSAGAAGAGAGVSDMDAHMIPFGTGTRTCGGQTLAQMMLRIVVAAVVRHFDVLARRGETDERSMEMKDAFVIFPASMECKLTFVPRKS